MRKSFIFAELGARLGVCLALAFATGGCATGADANDSGFGQDGDDASLPDGSGGDDEGVCLPHNCEADAECSACTEGRTQCYLPEKRCVACDPETGSGCEDGERCTEFGYCVEGDLDCPVDGMGEPTVECSDDPDCAACDTDHQVCAAGKCVACRGDNVEHCQSTEECVDNECVSSCPDSCTSDADCSSCGSEGHEAHACHHHQCAECSQSVPCPAGQACTPQGTCIDVCGLPGEVPGTCDIDGDCAGCPGDNTNCVVPVNGGHGVCGPVASGCSDLGSSVVVLPEPFSTVTNACSDDPDCAGVGVSYNVGKLLRELTGIDSIDDANIQYPMNSCADITVGVGDGSVSCGICVPCRVDADCMDLDIDEVADDAFGSVGGIAAALLLDQIFGDQPHTIYMFCEPVAAGYGVCAPCPTLLNDCATGSSGGSGNCDHDVCTAGTPLDPSCGSCAEAVCSLDDYCCTVEWDAQCQNLVEQTCAGSCTGGGTSCGHDQCETGAALDASCNACVADICAADPYCCQTSWDQTCVDLVDVHCGGQCAGAGCAHDECVAGGPLDAGCSDCASEVCAADSFCCSTDWDSVCTQSATSLCGC